jgi:hypothetical protein
VLVLRDGEDQEATGTTTTTAAAVASPQAVEQMFQSAYSSGSQSTDAYIFRLCQRAAGSVYCNWETPDGSTITMAARNTTGGLPILLVEVERGAP